MINITDKKDCNGCKACGDICATQAISFKTDIEGFWYPEVDKDKCTDCGLCDVVCPEKNSQELGKNNFPEPECYAAVHKNLEVRFDSTSGGIFSALAEKFYCEGGYVGGAIYNEDFSVSHFLSNKKKDLLKLRSSKYLQSDLSGFYKEVKLLLRSGEKVLICGTPCQMAAMRLFLKKDYENLVVLDFVCRGINTPKVFRKYLDSLEDKFSSRIVYVKAKSKELGWRQLTTKFVFENGETFFDTKETSLFTRGYLHTNVYCRPSCYSCKFKGFPRISDITLADFWGIEKFEKELDNDLGTSMVLINSNKGKNFFESLSKNIEYKGLPFDSIFAGNPSLTKSLDAPRVDRKQFFIDLDHITFFEVAQKYCFFSGKTWKQKIKDTLRNCLDAIRASQFKILPLYKFFKYNVFKQGITKTFVDGHAMLVTPYSVIEFHKSSDVSINGKFLLGYKKFKKSKLETRLLVESGAKLSIDGNFTLYYGADVEVLSGGELIIKGGNGGANINANIICSHRITIGEGVQMGRGVTIRDNNGGHFIARQGYKDKRPVIIGDRVWLCEGATIMSGVKIGNGAIVGAHSLVMSNVPANTIVSGNPAKLVDVDVLWKY